ncbi:MAG: hypothetical protein E7256_03155 [Lachnospiraceae bacterium]|nr:hypothetical protein [Lachnospiraceae bacterium]
MKSYRTPLSLEELPGYKKKSFSLFFAGSEIWAEHLDGMYQYADGVIQKFLEDALTFRQPSKPSLFAINLDETEVDERIEDAIALELASRKKYFTRVVFVGLPRKKQKTVQKKIDSMGRTFALAFMDDFEKAKEWLVAEG